MEQLALGLNVEVTRSRVTVVDPETGERGASSWSGPCGCFTCGLRHDGERWTDRDPKPQVFLLGTRGEGGLLYCEEHIDGAVRARQAQKERR